MHELREEDRKFLYQFKRDYKVDIYMSIYNTLKPYISKNKIEINTKDIQLMNDLTYKLTKHYMKNNSHITDFEQGKTIFKNVMAIVKFILYDIALREKGIKYSWLVRKNEEYAK